MPENCLKKQGYGQASCSQNLFSNLTLTIFSRFFNSSFPKKLKAFLLRPLYIACPQAFISGIK